MIRRILRVMEQAAHVAALLFLGFVLLRYGLLYLVATVIGG